MLHIAEDEEHLLGSYPFSYRFPLIEADTVKPENYQTDLKEFFQAMRCRHDKKRLIKLLQSEDFQKLSIETEQIIAVHLNMKGLLWRLEKEEKTMCKAVEDWIKDERNKGKREEKIQIIKRMKKEGMEESFIRQITKCTKAEYVAALVK